MNPFEELLYLRINHSHYNENVHDEVKNIPSFREHLSDRYSVQVPIFNGKECLSIGNDIVENGTVHVITLRKNFDRLIRWQYLVLV